MAVNSYPNGVVSSSTGGHATISSANVITDRRVLYVDSANTNADDANSGTDIEQPFASLAGSDGEGTTSGAYFAASAGDIIVIAASHVETIAWNTDATVTIDIAKAGLSIIGLGSGTTRPLFQCANDESYVFNITAVGVEIRNLRLRAQGLGIDESPATVTTLVRVNAGGCVIGECDFQAGPIPANVDGSVGANEYANTISMMLIGDAAAAVGTRIENCDFTNAVIVSTVTHGGPNISPRYGIYANGSFAATSTYIESCSFNGGTTGFDNGAIQVVSPTNLRIYNSTFTNGADISGTAFRGILSNNTMSASCRIVNDRLRSYPLGLIDASDGGNAILSNPNLYVTGNVYWVNNSASTASNSNAGTERDRPLSTIAQAITNQTAANGDLIIIESGHAQSLTTGVLISEDDTKIFGLGTSTAQKPSFTYTGITGGILLSLNATGCELHGLRFPVTAIGHTRVYLLNAQCLVEGCDFGSDANFDAIAIAVNAGSNADNSEINNCTFIITTAPTVGVSYTCVAIALVAASLRYNLIKNNTFDGGASTRGWSGGAIELGDSTTKRVVITGNTFLNGSDIHVTSSATNIVSTGNIMDATSRVEWNT